MQIRFLTQQEFENSDVLKLPETVPHPTDLAKILGVTNDTNTSQSDCYYWSNTYKENEFSDDLIYTIGPRLEKSIASESEQYIGIRPVIELKDFLKLSFTRYSKIVTTANGKQIKKIIFGAFPQDKVTSDINDSLLETDENFTFKGKNHLILASSSAPNKKYIQYKKQCPTTAYSYGGAYQHNMCEENIQQFQVQPIEWILDEKNNILIADKILIGNMSYSEAHYYINKYFKNEITQNTDIWQNKNTLSQMGYTPCIDLSHEFKSFIPIEIRMFQQKICANLKAQTMTRIEFLQAISKMATKESVHNQIEHTQIVDFAKNIITHALKHPEKTPKELLSQMENNTQCLSHSKKKNISAFQWIQNSKTR